jgi:hypothetical protein
MRTRIIFVAAAAAVFVCASASAQNAPIPNPNQLPQSARPQIQIRPQDPGAPIAPRAVADSPLLVRADLLRQAFPVMRGLGLPVVVSMRTPNVGNVYISANSATFFSAGPHNSRPGAAADGELTLRMEMGASLVLHIRSPGVASAVEFEGDAAEWSPEYGIMHVDSAGGLIESGATRGYASMVGLNRWLISVPAALGVTETVVSIRAPWDGNDVPRARLTFRRMTVTPINQ